MLHFTEEEFARRRAAVEAEMDRRNLDALLLFAPESHYWLTGYDTFGYCFFQCLIVGAEDLALLTRSADLRQAQLTSTIRDIRVWPDGVDAQPAQDLKAMLKELGLFGRRLGIETDTHGLTARNWLQIEAVMGSSMVEASDIIPSLRLVKSDAEIAYVREAADLADAALENALPNIKAGADEADILDEMQGTIFAGGGDYPANPFVIGSGDHALLCRYQTGRRKLDKNDQLTLEWAGVYRHYHAALMRTVVIGTPTEEHLAMQDAAVAALLACEAKLQPGETMGAVFGEHARVFDEAGLSKHRLNACGYALGARYAPSWMEREMFYQGAETVIGPGMVFFLHMILMDSASGCAVTLGRTSLVGAQGAEPLSRLPLDLYVR